MIDSNEIQALIQLADRAPKTLAEVQWLKSLVERLNVAFSDSAQQVQANGDSKQQKSSGG